MTGTIESAYNRLIQDRQRFLDEAYESALLTIPFLMPEPTDARHRMRKSTRELPKPWQSMGSRGVRNLASKLQLTLFPTEGSFIRYIVSAGIADQIREAAGGDSDQAEALLTDLYARLAVREQSIMDEVETGGHRVKGFLALLYLLVSGNALVYLPPEGGGRVFPLGSYGCRRDFTGNVLELAIVDPLSPKALPPNILAAYMESPEYSPDEADTTREKPVLLYTHVIRKGKRFEFRQEVGGIEIEGTSGSVRIEESPWLALRFTSIDGEDYGHGYVEEFRGDLQTLETLTQAVKIGAVNAAKLLPLVSPNGTVRVKDLVEAPNGQPILGREGDVTMLQQGKAADMRVAEERIMDIKRDLAGSFLLNSSFQRKGERVTAEEIRVMAQELEDTLGGVFSTLSQDMQLPFARRLEAQQVRQGKLKRLQPRDAVRISVVAGLAALGRGREMHRLREGLAFTAEVASVDPEAVDNINSGEILRRGWTTVGVDTQGIFRPRQEVAQLRQKRQQTAQAQALMDKAAGPATKAMIEQRAIDLGASGAQGQPPTK